MKKHRLTRTQTVWRCSIALLSIFLQQWPRQFRTTISTRRHSWNCHQENYPMLFHYKYIIPYIYIYVNNYLNCFWQNKKHQKCSLFCLKIAVPRVELGICDYRSHVIPFNYTALKSLAHWWDGLADWAIQIRSPLVRTLKQSLTAFHNWLRFLPVRMFVRFELFSVVV